MHRIPVSVPGGGYDVLLGDGIVERLPEFLDEFCPATAYALITDTNVASRHALRLAQRIGNRHECHVIPFPAGEAHKTRETWTSVTDQMLGAAIGRDAAVIAVGGGVVGDVAGFVAATYLRGIPYVQVPTTLLAMIDSSVGGKTGVDTPAGKNLVGAFHQPRAVVADIATLDTLPRRHFSAGLAEAIKHAAIADAAYFEMLANEAVTPGDGDRLVEVVRRSIEIKARVVSEDERETGPRAVLNAGHTIGHAAEAAGEYKLMHGEAVAIGLTLEAALGQALGITEPGTRSRLEAALERNGLPTTLPPHIPAAALLEAMRHDKKNRSRGLRFTLLRSIGEVARTGRGDWTFEVTRNDLIKCLRFGS